MVSKQGCAGDTGGGRMNQHLPEVENRPSEVMVVTGEKDVENSMDSKRQMSKRTREQLTPGETVRYESLERGGDIMEWVGS
jgi:hypothetical protein